MIAEIAKEISVTHFDKKCESIEDEYPQKNNLINISLLNCFRFCKSVMDLSKL